LKLNDDDDDDDDDDDEILYSNLELLFKKSCLILSQYCSGRFFYSILFAVLVLD